MWLQIIVALLNIVAVIIRSRSDKEQQAIGANDVIRKALAELVTRVQIAKKIDLDSDDWDREHIDSILSKYYRDSDQ